MTGDAGILDYGRLVREYETSLTDRLRAFRTDESYLELWVLDKDVAKSLANLFEAAGEVGHEGITVLLDDAAAAALDREHLESEMGDPATLTFTAREDGCLLVTASPRRNLAATTARSPEDASGSRSARRPAGIALAEALISAEAVAEPQEISAPYRRKVFEAAATASRRGPLAEKDGMVLATGTQNGTRITFRASPDTGLIDAAAFGSVNSPEAQGLLEAFAALAPGLTIQEAAEHGSIRLEAELRDDLAVRPVAGVALPRAADPAFRWVELLARTALADWRARTGQPGTANEFDDAPGVQWLALSAEARLEHLAEAIRAIGESEGIDVAGITVVAVEWNVRVVLRLPADMASAAKACALMQLERGLKRRVDRRLEVFSEELSDKNVIRRLT